MPGQPQRLASENCTNQPKFDSFSGAQEVPGHWVTNEEEDVSSCATFDKQNERPHQEPN